MQFLQLSASSVDGAEKGENETAAAPDLTAAADPRQKREKIDRVAQRARPALGERANIVDARTFVDLLAKQQQLTFRLRRGVEDSSIHGRRRPECFPDVCLRARSDGARTRPLAACCMGLHPDNSTGPKGLPTADRSNAAPEDPLRSNPHPANRLDSRSILQRLCSMASSNPSSSRLNKPNRMNSASTGAGARL